MKKLPVQPMPTKKKPATKKPAAKKPVTKTPLVRAKEKPANEETKRARQRQTNFLTYRGNRELTMGPYGANTNVNLGGQADSSGYSPYTLS